MVHRKTWIFILLLLSFLMPLKATVWEEIENIPAPYDMNYWLDVFFLPSNPNYGWICGYQGMVLRTTDRGETWQGSTINLNHHLESVHFVTPYVGYTSGVPGIFRSVDGGVTWTDISIPEMIGRLWGCYFLTENVGFAVGGGCDGDGQYFWKTTNGGQTWTTYTLDEFNSGMTDVMVYSESGLGYAVGSGVVYITNDGGTTWQNFFNTEYISENNRWQEEITNIGSSFLVPYSGWVCAGGGNSGGMYFTTDNGQTFNRFACSDPLYGAFLISAQVGWTCGYNGAVYYTENAGNTWSKKSCGINPNHHLDDIWFITPTEGWVVGNGIYKLSNSTQDISADEIYFRSVCYPGYRIDSVMLYNNSFTPIEVSVNVTQSGYVSEYFAADPEPGDVVTLGSCDSLALKVEFSPQSIGYKEAYLNVVVDGVQSYSVHLHGFSSGSTAEPSSDKIDFDTVYCSTAKRDSIGWKATYPNEFLDSCKFTAGRDAFACQIDSSMNIGEVPQNQYFDFAPIDTGYYEATYCTYLQPCYKKKDITLCGYAVSSIINARDTVITLSCPPSEYMIISIPVWNTGNYDLLIDEISLSNNDFAFYGFDKSSDRPTIIPIDSTDSLRIRARISGKNKVDSCIILLQNNDSTKTRGEKNPYSIKIVINNEYASVQAVLLSQPDSVICFGDEISLDFTLENVTGKTGEFLFYRELENCEIAVSPQLPSTFTLNARNKNKFSLQVSPLAPGEFSAKLYFKNIDCDAGDSIIIRGRAEDFDVNISLEEITMRLQTDEPDSLDLTVHTFGNSTTKLDSVRLKNPFPEINFSYTPTEYVAVGVDSFDLKLYFTCSKDTIYNDTLLLYFSGICPKIVSLPIHIICVAAKISALAGNYEPDIFCDLEKTVQVPIIIKNYGTSEDNILRIESFNQQNGQFVLQGADFPRTIYPDEEFTYYVEFTPSDTGYASAEIRIYSERMNDGFVPVYLQFYSALTDLMLANSYNNLGKVEHCDAILFDTLKVLNRGNLASDVEINMLSSNAINNISASKFNISAFSEKDIILEIIPEKIKNYGMNYDTLEVIDRTCGDTCRYAVDIFKIFAESELNKSSIEFENLWAEIPAYDTLKLTNNSNIPLVIREINITGEGVEYVTFGGVSAGDTLESKISYPIYVCLKAPSNAKVNLKVAINYELNCPLENTFEVSGRVPDEVYFVKLRTEHYLKEPNEEFAIKIFNESAPELKVDVDSVRFSLNYLPKIISRQSIQYGENTIEICRKEPDLQFVILGDEAERFINTSGDSLLIHSIAMLALPDSCALDISETEIFSPKRIIVNTENGSFKLINYCRGIAPYMNFEYFDVAAKINNSSNSSINIDMKSNKTAQFEITLIDAVGNCVINKNYEISGSQNKIIDTSNLASGSYIAIVKVFEKVIEQKKIIIIK